MPKLEYANPAPNGFNIICSEARMPECQNAICGHMYLFDLCAACVDPQAALATCLPLAHCSGSVHSIHIVLTI